MNFKNDFHDKLQSFRTMTYLIALAYVVSISFQVRAELVVKPRDTEAVIGDSTYFDCASNVNTNEVNWYHFAVGAKDYEDICLYCLGRIHPKYEQKIQVEQNFSTGNSRLIIKSVQRQDAGRYICQDNGGIGESSFAELVILESIPTCKSNMKPDGVLGPNDCGLQPDTIHLSCHMSYHGNIPPVIKWRRIRTGDSLTPSFCHNIDNRITCNLSITVDIGQNGASYICETNRSTATTQFNCLSDIIRVIYVKSNNSTRKMVHGTDEKIFCSVNSSQSCINTWKWFDGVDEEFVSKGSALVTQKPGWYKCESECNIRDKQCTVLSKLVHVSESQTGSMPMVIAGTCMMAIVLLCTGLICIVILRKRPIGGPTRSEESRTLIDAEEQTNSVSKVTTNAARERGLLIRGITILGNELFVLTQKCQEVEIFDCNTLGLVRQWILMELIRPSDIASCKENRCLYIMDWKCDSDKKEVLCVDPNGKLLRNWVTGDDHGYLISVSNEQNLIITCYGKCEFNEYSPEGIMIRKVCLLNTTALPRHAVKLTNGDFVVGIGDFVHMLHSVCIVDADGKVKKSFGKERGSDLEHMDHPIYLNVCEDGFVAVLDSVNQRVVLLDKDLKFNKVLLSFKMHGLQNPTRILFDESSDRLFVAGNRKGSRNEIGEILVFHLNQFA